MGLLKVMPPALARSSSPVSCSPLMKTRVSGAGLAGVWARLFAARKNARVKMEDRMGVS